LLANLWCANNTDLISIVTNNWQDTEVFILVVAHVNQRLRIELSFFSRSLAQPYTLEKFLKDKINAKLEEKRTKRVQLQSKLPGVNKDLFLKLKDQETNKKKAKTANLVFVRGTLFKPYLKFYE